MSTAKFGISYQRARMEIPKESTRRNKLKFA